MLTRKQIVKLREEGWKFVLKRGRHPKGYTGLCDPESEEMRTYLPAVKGLDELSRTFCHELIHARENIIRSAARNGDKSEDEIEQEARETYRRDPAIAAFIARVYSLDIEDYFIPLHRTTKNMKI